LSIGWASSKTLTQNVFGFLLHKGHLKAINQLKKACWDALGSTLSLKVHIMFNHVGPWGSKFGRGLGLTSEQALESIHVYFKEIDNPRWAENMLQTVLEFLALNCIVQSNAPLNLHLCFLLFIQPPSVLRPESTHDPCTSSAPFEITNWYVFDYSVCVENDLPCS
jgi:hypothetical protein